MADRAFQAETQKERWLKYGGNVALTIVVVVLLGGLLVYLGQRFSLRRDMTVGGTYSLKPQTVRLIEALPQKVKIVGLFSKAKQASEKKQEEDTAEARYQQVADLLQEYQQKSGGKITYEMIDPVNENGKVDQLFKEVATKYGNDTGKYEDIIRKKYPEMISQFEKLTAAEKDILAKLPKSNETKIGRFMGELTEALDSLPAGLKKNQASVLTELDKKVPDYKRATDTIRDVMDNLNGMMDGVPAQFTKLAEDKATPPEYKAYFQTAPPRYEEMKKVANDLMKSVEGLGSIRQLDDLRQNKTNSIAVMGEKDLKVLPLSAIYKKEDARFVQGAEKAKPRFAGEQQISTALVVLTSKEKKKVATIRSGGPPATISLPMMNYTGFMNAVTERLRDLDITTVEKDVSGAWAAQAAQMQMQGMPIPPEPSDEELKDATWIVMFTPQDPRQMLQNPQAGQLGPKLAAHLKGGGSAMVLTLPGVEKLDFLKEYGIEVKPDYLVMHDRVEATGPRGDDRTEEWQRQQAIFKISDYGDSPVTKSIRSLDALLAGIVPISVVEAKGYKTWPILPVPTEMKAWGESDLDSLRSEKPATFTPTKDGKPDDLSPPLWGGAVSEGEKGSRLVVLGTLQSFMNTVVQEPDMELLLSSGRFAPRFPGNAELFVNSIFWLTKMDTMIAISPTALEVPRVAPVGDGALAFWRWGVLIIGMPLLVLAAGSFVYLKRRD